MMENYLTPEEMMESGIGADREQPDDYLDDLHERLRDSEEAANYLAAALKERHCETLRTAVKDVVAANERSRNVRLSDSSNPLPRVR